MIRRATREDLVLIVGFMMDYYKQNNIAAHRFSVMDFVNHCICDFNNIVYVRDLFGCISGVCIVITFPLITDNSKREATKMFCHDSDSTGMDLLNEAVIEDIEKAGIKKITKYVYSRE